MRALVTGGTGFVGSAVVRALLASGAQVVCLARPGSNHKNLEGLDISLAEGDLGDSASLRQALRGCQQLYHVAAFYSTRPEDAETMWAINVEGSRNILQAALDLGVEQIVHTSTIGAIGRPADGRLPTERDLFDDWANASPYARSKLEAERVALELAARGAPIVVVNPCAPIGARDIKPSSSGARIIAYLQGRTPSFLSGGINFVSVEDVALGHLLAARHGQVGERYILGHAEGNLTLDDFCALMERVSGLPLPRQTSMNSPFAALRAALHRLRGATHAQSAGRSYRPQALTADPTRAIRELSLPQTSLEVAFRQAIVWFRANGYV